MGLGALGVVNWLLMGIRYMSWMWLGQVGVHSQRVRVRPRGS